jgi:hypothetical protein
MPEQKKIKKQKCAVEKNKALLHELPDKAVAWIYGLVEYLLNMSLNFFRVRIKIKGSNDHLKF